MGQSKVVFSFALISLILSLSLSRFFCIYAYNVFDRNPMSSTVYSVILYFWNLAAVNDLLAIEYISYVPRYMTEKIWDKIQYHAFSGIQTI